MSTPRRKRKPKLFEGITAIYVGMDECRERTGKHVFGFIQDQADWDGIFANAQYRGFEHIWIHVPGLTHLASVQREQIEEGAI